MLCIPGALERGLQGQVELKGDFRVVAKARGLINWICSNISKVALKLFLKITHNLKQTANSLFSCHCFIKLYLKNAKKILNKAPKI